MWEEWPQFYEDLTIKNNFLEESPCFKFNNFGLALGIVFKLCNSVAKVSKLKFEKFVGLLPTFVEVKGEKLVGRRGLLPAILNRVDH